jgi:outer membrane protein TolC
MSFKKLMIIILIFLSNLKFLFALTLNEAIELAVKNSPFINMADEGMASKQYQKYGVQISRFGEVTAVGNYTHYNLERTLTPMVPPIKPPFPLSDDDITNIGVSYTLPIFTGFKLSKNISIASLNYEIAKAQSSLTKRQIEFNVYSIFLKGLSLKEQLKAKLEHEKALAELHKNVEIGVKVGRYAAMDLKKVDYQYEMVKAQRQSIENNIKVLKTALNQLTGMESEDWDFDPVELNFDPVALENNFPSLSELKKIALINREDVLITSKKKEIASLNYSKSKYSYLPDIAANYTYVRSIGGGGSVPLWNYGLVLQWPIFDFGKRAMDIISQKHEYKIAKESEIAQKLSVNHDVIEAYTNLQNQLAVYNAAKKALSYAKDVKEAENIKYEQNAGSMYDLLQSISQYYDALSQERGSYYSVFTSYKYLEFVVGGKWKL